MKIGVIGAGRIGATAARLFARAGHDVALSNSRGPASLAGTVAAINGEVGGSPVRATTADEAASFGDVTLLAAPWPSLDRLPKPDELRGKIVIDAMNPYSAPGQVIDLGTSTSSEEVARRLPGARVVKAFNTIYWDHLAKQGRTELPLGQRRAIFIAGDDAAAKKVVGTLIEEIGFAPVDTGGLRDGGRGQQPGSPVYNRDLTHAEAVAILATTS